MVVVLSDRPAEIVIKSRLHNILVYFFEFELRRVYPEYDQPMIRVLFVPAPQCGERSNAVDACVGPEIDQDDIAPLLFEGKGFGVDPTLQPDQLDGQHIVRGAPR